MRLLFAGCCAATLALAGPALADSLDNQSAASADSAKAVAALVEAGVKTTAAVVALPVALAGAGSVAAGGSAKALGGGAVAVGRGTLRQAGDAARFADQPLSVTDDVVVTPQPAPQVPYQAGDQRK